MPLGFNSVLLIRHSWSFGSHLHLKQKSCILVMLFISCTPCAILYVSLILYKPFGYINHLMGDSISTLLIKLDVVLNVASGEL